MKQLYTCIISLAALPLFSQNTSVFGTVTDQLGQPLAQVNMQLNEQGTMTDNQGQYHFSQVPIGQNTLSINYLGYETLTFDFQVNKDDLKKLDFTLRETVTDLPEVVISSVSMTGGSAGLHDLPGSAAYISPRQIQKFNYTDVSRTLRAVPGVNIQEEDGFGLRPNIGLRGTGVDRSAKITLMEDGVLMAPAPYAAPEAYYFPSFGRMQAVEVLKGSSQIQYGPYTTGGAINLISTQIPDQLSGKIQMSGSSFGGKQLHTWIGHTFDRSAFLVETFTLSSDGFKTLDNGGPTGFDKQDYLVKYRLQSPETARIFQTLTFKAGLTEESSNETYTGLTQTDFAAHPFRRYAGSQLDLMETRQTQMSLRYTAALSQALDLEVIAYRNDFHRNWYKLDKIADSTGTKVGISDLLSAPEDYADAYNIISGSSTSGLGALYVKANNRTYYAQGLETILHYEHQGTVIRHRVSVGLRVHEDQVDRFQWQDSYAMDNGVMELLTSGTPGTESNRLVTANALSGWMQYKMRWKSLSVTPGLRIENIFLEQKNYGTADPDRLGSDLTVESNRSTGIIPGILVDYDVNKRLSVFTGVHKGFAPAGPLEEARPESSVNYEAGSRFIARNLHIQLVAFYTDYQNLLGVDLAASGGAGTGELYNGGAATAYGIESGVSTDLLGNKPGNWSLPFRMTYTYTNAYFNSSFESALEDWGDVEAGDELPYLAHHQVYGQVSVEYHPFALNIGSRYNSAMRAVAGQGAIPEEEKIDAQWVTDLTASYQCLPQVQVWGGINNLSDEVYVAAMRPAGLRPGLPRTFTIGLKALIR
jgi:Fe(3+) dicitrate transport protein